MQTNKVLQPHNLSDAQLLDVATEILSELERRYNGQMNGKECIYFEQNRERLVCLEDGTPADMPGWLYLPSLKGISKYFQPITKGAAKIYTEVFPKGARFFVKDRRTGNVVGRLKP